MTEYIALIHKDSDSDFGVSFPDLPGCITAGATLEEARQMAAEALAFHLEGLEEDGDEVPAPSSLDEVMADPENRDGVVMVVPAPAGRVARSERINVIVPVRVLKRIDDYVKSKGYSRSGFLVAAAETAMDGAEARGTKARSSEMASMGEMLDLMEQANVMLAWMVRVGGAVQASEKTRVKKFLLQAHAAVRRAREGATA